MILHVFSDSLAAGHNVEPPVREQVAYVKKKKHPEVTEIFGDFKFRGQGQTASTLNSPATQSLNPEPFGT